MSFVLFAIIYPGGDDLNNNECLTAHPPFTRDYPKLEFSFNPKTPK